jgi:hypothetical protein
MELSHSLCGLNHRSARYIFTSPTPAPPNDSAISTDSECSPYLTGGLGPNLQISLLADGNMRVARGVRV